jgi:hypothetical protein
VIITTWRTKLTLVAGIPLLGTGLLLAMTGPGAEATTAPPAPAASPSPGSNNTPTAVPATLPASPRATLPAATPLSGAGSAAASGSATGGGDNGTVKIHRSTTPVSDRRNEPHVCVFYLDAFGFDAGQSVTWKIESWPPTGDRSVVTSGKLTLDSNGDGHTSDMTLPSGHYKLFWNFTGENGFAKQKVFWVECAATPPPTSPPPSTPTTPSPSPSGAGGLAGQLPTTGWPLALIAGAGVGLLGTGTAAIVVARRRRGLHIS